MLDNTTESYFNVLLALKKVNEILKLLWGTSKVRRQRQKKKSSALSSNLDQKQMVDANSGSNRMNLRLLWIKQMGEVGPDHMLGRIEKQEDIRVFSKEQSLVTPGIQFVSCGESRNLKVTVNPKLPVRITVVFKQ